MTKAEKLSVTLPRELADLVRRRVEAGDYASDSEVIQEALRLWQAHDESRHRRLDALREKVGRSLDDPRPSVPGDEVFDELESRYVDE